MTFLNAHYVHSPSPTEDVHEELFGISSYWGKQCFVDQYPILDCTKSDE